MEENKILPIGSVVKVNDMKMMIVGYYPIIANRVYLYSACEYPVGMLNINVTFGFNNQSVEEIYYRGYENNSFKDYAKLLKDSIIDLKNVIKNKEDL